MARSGAEAFRGTDRFEVTGYLGEGGMGIVYRAVDRERDVEVALKTLHNVSAAAIFRFKQEFRALADVAHPNLVALHELFCEKEQWFFTMELIDGVDLLTHVCGQALDADRSEHPTHHATVPERSAVTGPTRRFAVDDTLAPGDAPRAGAAPLRGRPLIGRLRLAVPQLVAGITALHESGHLHQDIKPSNVMVTLAGRVVLMDFGVVAELRQRPGEPGEAAGTPAYMAPERLRDAQSTPASDWYSVGVVLYYALAGRLPFAGTPEQVLADKLHSQPAPIRLQRPEVPEDLDQLCMDLLRADPAQRPTGAEVLRRLGAAAEHEERRAVAPAPLAADELALVGRQAHLDALRGALARARTGAGAAVLVHGTSGMGKSALVRAFLEEVRVDRGAIVLAGRCYERESVPYSAVDTVVDALCQHLVSLPAAELAAIVPEDAGLLATLFPVLRRVPGIGEEPADDDVATRPHELRRRAFAALRALLVRIAERCPLVLLIDDLQWGDADSAPLLDLITRAPGAPAMLLLGCYRTDEEHRSELLRASFWRDGRRDMEWLPVGALEPAQARELARTLLGGVDDVAAEAVALESAGNPFFIQELVRYRSTGEHGAAGDIPSLDVVIRARLDRLGDDARRAVEVLAVAGRPLLQRVARTAAGIAEADWPILVQLIGTNRLVRVSGRRGDDLIECYHDRIRETLTARIPPTELSTVHRQLATALEETARVDPEMMAHHFEAAGDLALAARYALQAADLAAAALAFDRAASLYQRALALRPGGADELDLRLRLAAALVNGGRGAEAARIYVDAAAKSDDAGALELRRLAAEQLLRSGHVDEGLAVLAEVLGAVGLSLPRSAGRSIPSLLWRRLRLRLRGLDPARAPRTSPGDRAMLDICRTASLGLALFDPVRSATFSTRHVLLALDSGDLARISFALAIEAGYMASEREPVRANELLGRAEAIAHSLGHPVLHGCVAVIRAILSYERGDFREAFEGCERAEDLLRDHLTGMAWELRTVQMFSLHSLFFLGDMQAMVQRTAHYIADARERGDLYAIMNIRSLAGSCVHAIISDDPAGALAEIAEVEGQFPGSGFYVQHMFLLYARTFVDLYQGRADAAYQRLVDVRPQVRSSLLLHDRGVRTFFHFLLGGSAVGAIRHRPAERGRLRRVALRAARLLWRDGATPYLAMASVLRAAVAASDQDVAGASEHLRAAVADFDRAGMALFSVAAQRRLGQIQGTAEGDELAARIDGELRAGLVTAPEKALRILTPGFPEEPPILPPAR